MVSEFCGVGCKPKGATGQRSRPSRCDIPAGKRSGQKKPYCCDIDSLGEIQKLV